MAANKETRLTEEQSEMIAELVQDAIGKAVFSMEKMLQIRMRANHVVYKPGNLGNITEFDQLGRFKVHVVKLFFSGDIQGAFYFLILDHEVDLINSVCLPEEFKSEKRAQNKMMKHGFMSEIENIIAALSIEQISEALGVRVELKVPQIEILPGNEVNKFFEKQNKIYKTAFHVKAVLEGKVVNIAPYFIWLLNDKFLNVLRLNTSGM